MGDIVFVSARYTSDFDIDGDGENALSAKVEAPETIETFLPLIELVTAEAQVIFIALFLMSLSEGGVSPPWFNLLHY
jgi:hypothetical protein